MSVWLDKPRHRPDGRHKTSGRTTIQSASQNFPEILSCFEPCPNGVALLFGRSHFSCTQFPYQGFSRPDQGNGHPDDWSNARNFHISSSRVRTMKAVTRTSEFWVRNLPYGWARPDGNPHVWTVAAIFPYLCFGKKSYSCSNTECRSDVLLKGSDGCKLEQFKASWHRGRSGRKVLVVRTNDALDSWASGRFITSSEGLKGIQFF
jgi:hypothetical protein